MIADKIISTAESQLGITENPPNSNQCKYNIWFYKADVSGAAYPWCMTFVQWVYDKAGQRLPFITASCSALLNWYKAYKPACIIKNPVPGCIVIYNFGHTGIVVKDNANGTITAIEGNTSSDDRGSQSNGGGVFKRIRAKSLVTAYILPFTELKEPKESEDDDMKNTEENYHVFKQFMDRYMKERETLPVPDWAKDELQEAINAGITDGTRPCSFATRCETAVMRIREVKK